MNFNFSPEESLKFNDLSEAKSALKDKPYKVQRVKPGELSVKDDGTFVFASGEEKKPTAFAFSRVLDHLGIPKSFANRIDNDLLLKNISELLPVVGELSVITRNGVVCGAASSSYIPVDTPYLIERLEPEKDKFSRVEVEHGDYGTSICFIRKDFPVFQPKEGDTIESGIEVFNSMTGGPRLRGQSYLYRLTCENGATVRSALGVVRCRTYNLDGIKLDPIASVQDFVQRLPALKDNIRDLKMQDRLKKMMEPVPEPEFLTILNKLFKVIGDRVRVLTKFDLDEKDYSELRISVREWRVSHDRNPAIRQIVSPTSYYNAFNVITRFGEEEPNNRRAQSLREWGGRVLELVEMN